MLLTKQRVYWLITKKQIEKKTLIISLKKGFFKSFSGQNKLIVAFNSANLENYAWIYVREDDWD